MPLENSALLSLKSFLRKRAPHLLVGLGRFYGRYVVYSRERAYLKGRVLSSSEQPSLILLSCNRAGTQFVEDVLSRVFKESGGEYLALNRSLFFMNTVPKGGFLELERMSAFFQPKGFFFGQQGPFAQFEKLADYRLIVTVRDPRDLLVSHFHSLSKAHLPRDKGFAGEIKRAQELGIQKYVLDEEVQSYYLRAMRQASHLKDHENVLFYRYEDIMEDFRAFVVKSQEFILGRQKPKLTEELMPLFKSPSQGDALNKHRRSGRWGQFQKSLEAEVIVQLNDTFEPYLREFGYLDENNFHVQ